MSDLKNIFDAIVPENIRNVPVIRDSMSIFLQNLEDNAAISIDIRKIYEQQLDPTKTLNSTSKQNLRMGLLDVYFNSLYNVLKEAQSNTTLQDKLDFRGVKQTATINNTPESIIGTDYAPANKQYKESIGTINGILQTYSFAKNLESNNDNAAPNINEIKPFHLLVEGSLTPEMYSSIVEPISHPLGFTYKYKQIVSDSLNDFFGITNTYNLNNLEVRNSNGLFTVFSELNGETPQPNNPNWIPDQTTPAFVSVWNDFQTRTNIKTGNLFTLNEFLQQVTIWPNKTVQDITDTTDNIGRTASVLFADGTYIYQQPGNFLAPNLLFVNYDLWLNSGGTDGIIENYNKGGHYSLYLDYAKILNFDYYDTIEQFLIDFNITQINDNTGGTDQITYIDYNGVAQPIGTSDFVIMTSPQYVQESFDGYAYSNKGNYIVTTDAGSTSLHLTTSETLPNIIFDAGTNTGVTGVTLGSVGTNINEVYTLTAAANGDLTITSLAGATGTQTFIGNSTQAVTMSDSCVLNITFGATPAGTGGETNSVTVPDQDSFTVGAGANAAFFTVGTLSNSGTNTKTTYTFTDTSTTTAGTITVKSAANTVGTINIISGTASTQSVTLTDSNTLQFVYDGSPLNVSTSADAGTLITKQGSTYYLTVTP